jgi:D-alanyl-lipoteichoic acid acyltransferase DltB (MBOAT superfamily)
VQFNSLSFAVFLAGALLLYHLPRSWRVRKLNLLCASYVFYMAWNPPFVALLWISTVADWWLARRIARSEGLAARRGCLAASLGVNLGLLGFFKYGDFALRNATAVARAAGIDFQPAAPDIVLPMGISFYTFQTLSYTFDVYRRHLVPARSFLDYALFVTFFPQLVAGPIVRAGVFLPQTEAPRRGTAEQWSWGLSLVTLGLFQKVVLADGLLAPVAEGLFDSQVQPDAASAWLGTVAFSGQIFCDFSGYSSCAIGLALCFGFLLPENFRSPYAAVGFSDFWRRWHVSLSTWLRDYLYIALGGSRKGPRRTTVNLMLTMLIGGLWHGASWTFVAWGGLHGLYLVLERQATARLGGRAFWRRAPVRLVLGLLTFAVVTVTWAFFRAHDFGRAFAIVGAMLGAGPAGAGASLVGDPMDPTWVGLVMVPLLAAHWGLRETSLEAAAARVPWWLHSLALALMWIAIAMTPGSDRAFIYFRF